MQVRTSLQTDNYTITPRLSFFTGRMPSLPPNQQRQSTEGIMWHEKIDYLLTVKLKKNCDVQLHIKVQQISKATYQLIYFCLHVTAENALWQQIIIFLYKQRLFHQMHGYQWII